MSKTWLALEIAVIFILVELQIWVWNDWPWIAALPILGVVASWYFRGDNFRTLGLYPKPLPKGMFAKMFWCFLTTLLIAVAIGLVWDYKEILEKIHTLKFWHKYTGHIVQYFFWALLQQLWACGYFANRINQIISSHKKTALITAILFATVHWPNPVLVPVTFVGGWLSAYFFLKTRNLYLLAIAHGVLGSTLKHILPRIWLHGLRIGTGF